MSQCNEFSFAPAERWTRDFGGRRFSSRFEVEVALPAIEPVVRYAGRLRRAETRPDVA